VADNPKLSEDAPEAPSTRFAGFKINPEATKQIAVAVGGFLVNFGALEMIANGWVARLSHDGVLVAEIQRLPFWRRVKIIHRLMQAGRIPAEFQAEAQTAWKEAEQLAEIRNQIAHNPTVFGWHGPERPAPPDYAGVLDTRKHARQTARTPGLITLAELAHAQNAAGALAQRLGALADRIDEAMAATRSVV